MCLFPRAGTFPCCLLSINHWAIFHRQNGIQWTPLKYPLMMRLWCSRHDNLMVPSYSKPNHSHCLKHNAHYSPEYLQVQSMSVVRRSTCWVMEGKKMIMNVQIKRVIIPRSSCDMRSTRTSNRRWQKRSCWPIGRPQRIEKVAGHSSSSLFAVSLQYDGMLSDDACHKKDSAICIRSVASFLIVPDLL